MITHRSQSRSTFLCERCGFHSNLCCTLSATCVQCASRGRGSCTRAARRIETRGSDRELRLLIFMSKTSSSATHVPRSPSWGRQGEKGSLTIFVQMWVVRDNLLPGDEELGLIWGEFGGRLFSTWRKVEILKSAFGVCRSLRILWRRGVGRGRRGWTTGGGRRASGEELSRLVGGLLIDRGREHDGWYKDRLSWPLVGPGQW